MEPALFNRLDIWDTSVLCVSVAVGTKALCFHIGMTGLFALNFSPLWGDPHREFRLSLKKIVRARRPEERIMDYAERDGGRTLRKELQRSADELVIN